MKRAPNPWAQYALVIELARKLHASGNLGKKALQKLVYLLQELEGVDTGYRFRFFTYGPFADELAYTLDIVEGMGGVRVDYQPTTKTYRISPGSKADALVADGAEFIRANQEPLDRTIQRFGAKSAKELELLATIVYLHDDGQPITTQVLIDAVQQLKPKYQPCDIAKAAEELARFGYLKLA